jgi:hypothetical protein
LWRNTVVARGCSDISICDNFKYACYQDCDGSSGCEACCDGKHGQCVEDQNCNWPLGPSCQDISGFPA